MKLTNYLYTAFLFASCATSHNATDVVQENNFAEREMSINSSVSESNAAQSQEISESRSSSEINRFAFSLFEQIYKSDSEANICISPTSASAAISMVANGAEGNTLEQILHTLSAANLDELNNRKIIGEQAPTDDTTLKSANSIWVNENQPVKEKFIEVNKLHHDAQISNVPFNANTVAAINDWCSQQTNGKINNILDKLDENSRMILINALYLKGRWGCEFNESSTYDERFTKPDGTTTDVKMMHQTLTTGYSMDSNVRIVAMPFINSNIEVQFILPQQGTSIGEAASHLAANYHTLNSNMNRQKIKLSLPRFKVDYKKSLKDALTAMGMSDAFSNKANFKGISDEPLLINDVFQKTYIKVDEKGAEAAAVTAIMVGLMSSRPTKPIEVKFNRPFIYTIVDKSSNNILFIGAINNPIE